MTIAEQLINEGMEKGISRAFAARNGLRPVLHLLSEIPLSVIKDLPGVIQ